MQRIAILGAGFMGRTHADAYRNIPNAKLVAICDQDESAAAAFAAEYGCAAYPEAGTMLDAEAVEVVDICLPTFLHEQHTLQAAEKGAHVICEKPAALSLAAFDRMTEAVTRAGKRLFVGQVLRFWPEYAAMARMYQAGELGELAAVHAARISTHPDWSPWYRRVENSGGGLFDLHLHDIDYLCSLFGRPERVYAVGRKNGAGCWNHVATTLRFRGGNAATAEGILEMQQGYPFTMSMRMAGLRRSVEYIMRAGVNLENVGAAQRESLVFEDGVPPRPLTDDTSNAYQSQLAYFIDCIEQGKEPELVTVASVRTTLETVLAIQRALETAQEVRM